MTDKIDFAGMGDDERARRDLKEAYEAAKKFASDADDKLKDGLRIPDKLMDDVVQCMFGANANGAPAVRIEFVNGPFDGMRETMNATPDVLAMRVDPLQVQIVGRRVAVSIFYDVAVYEFIDRPDTRDGRGGVYYRFAGFSECMEGLG